jgi:hypothetical protein
VELRHGGGSRVKKIIDTLKQHSDSTTIVLTELRNNENANIIQSALADMGLFTSSQRQLNQIIILFLLHLKKNLNRKHFPN